MPQQPWEYIAIDFFYVNGGLYVLVCDYFSKFPFVFQTRTTSFANLRDHLQELFMVEGTPDEIMSDNGPPFNGKEFSTLLTGLGIRHTTLSPNYPQSSSSVSNCFAGQVHQELGQGQTSKDPASTGDWWRSLFPFREGSMANWHSDRDKRHWEKLWHPDRWENITEEEQVPSQARKPWHSNNITIFCFQDLNTLPK